MKLPEKPPKFSELMKRRGNEFLSKGLYGGNPEMAALVNKINQEHYFYWEKLRHYRALTEKFDAELLWMAAKVSRNTSAKQIPLTDLEGKNFIYNRTEKIGITIHEIDRGNPTHIGVDLPLERSDYPRYILDSLMEEAIASSQLEGAATTREVAKEMLRTGRKPKDNSETMILNNFLTMQEIKKIKTEPLSKDLILHLHTYLMKGTMEDSEAVGRFRMVGEPVGVYDITDNTELYVAPSAELLDVRINKLIEFANADHNRAENFIHPVLKAIMLHFWMAYEHPFIDGNGRTARALFYWFMLKNGYWLFEFLSISRVFNRSPMKYMRSFLWTEYDDNDLTYFISFNVKALSWALKQLGDYIAERQEEKYLAARLLKNVKGLNERQYSILSEALQNSNRVFTIELQRSTFDVVYQTARQDLLHLVDRGYLENSRRGKKFFFFPAKDLREKLSRDGI